ncbi:MAG TPA: hypothetical protein VNW54_02740 [Granulicella sp.]|jgi:hypothetical protein|nr:hypothetical protein [Granulicella sp.]
MITACRQTLLGVESWSNEGYVPAEYIVTFSYAVDGRAFEGNYRANSPQECGHAFEILYDPEHPSKNTGSDVLQTPWIRIAAWGLAGIFVFIGIWLWGRKEWFQW